MNCVPAAVACSAASPYGLMPGDLITTSNAAKASPVTSERTVNAPAVSARAAAASASGQNRVSGSDGNR